MRAFSIETPCLKITLGAVRLVVGKAQGLTLQGTANNETLKQ